MPSASTTSHSTPRVKRPFQPSITTFFSRAEDHDTQNPAFGATSHISSRSTTTPALPAPVQASLLNVGMRVRKSVPEGYKTHKQLQTINTGVNAASSEMYSVKSPREAVPDEYQHPRELLPFCGLHKIGGFAEQPVTNTHLYERAHAVGEGIGNSRPVPVQPLIFPLPAEAFNIPFSSQDSATSTPSTISTDSAPARNPNNKRTWSDDDQPVTLNTNFLFAHSIKEDEAPVSPLSSTPSQSLPFGNATSDPTALRPFAQPRTRSMRRQQARMDGFNQTILKAQAQGMDIDLENAARSDDATVDDFGEAEFLRPTWDGEVEMGGV